MNRQGEQQKQTSIKQLLKLSDKEFKITTINML